MRVIVLANGEWDSEWGRLELTKEKTDLLICADGGANLAISSGVLPDILLGDLDSITQENLKKCQDVNVQIKKFPSQKDQTDLELAIEYAQAYLESYGTPNDEILLYAAGGKRLDHLQGNIALMLGFAQKGRRIKMIDKTYDAWIMLASEEIVRGHVDQEISLIALSEEAQVSSQGLFYKLDNLTLSQNATRGISNVFTQEEVQIKIFHGNLLIVLIKDLKAQ
ncbi:MAG: thiamine pyrophosphokinase [Gracilibacter sp. BRH_c7a]|nr:MAG: thiamine pyrophosphokinase [Gracilibacter sp. BRH_c7a]